METQEKDRLKRYENIDCLRALSCIAIIIMHVRANAEYLISDNVRSVVQTWTWLVYLFLIISGFSMCCGYYEKVVNGTIDIEQFYLKRFKKTIPFFACLVVLAVVTEHTLEGLFEGVMEVTLAYGLLPNNNMSILGVCWTLGVIFLFYMLFPYFVFLLKNKKRAWMTLIITLIINQICTQYFFTEKFVIDSFTPRHSFLFCTPFFVGGGVLFLYREKIEEFISKHRYPMFIVCLITNLGWYICPHSIVGIDLFTIESLILFTLWLSYAISVKSHFMNNRVMKYIGSISMEMYLAQMIVFRVLEKLKLLYILGHGVIGLIGVTVIEVVVLIIGIESYKHVELLVKSYFAKNQ